MENRNSWQTTPKKSSSVAGGKPDLVWQRYVILHQMSYICACAEICLHESMGATHQFLQSLNVSKN